MVLPSIVQVIRNQQGWAETMGVHRNAEAYSSSLVFMTREDFAAADLSPRVLPLVGLSAFGLSIELQICKLQGADDLNVQFMDSAMIPLKEIETVELVVGSKILPL